MYVSANIHCWCISCVFCTREVIREKKRLPQDRSSFMKNGWLQETSNPSCLCSDLHRTTKEGKEKNKQKRKINISHVCWCSVAGVTPPPPDISLAQCLALSLASGRRCCHCRSKLISHHRIWTRRQVQIFNLLDISWASATHRHITQIASLKFTCRQIGAQEWAPVCLWSWAFVADLQNLLASGKSGLNRVV